MLSANLTDMASAIALMQESGTTSQYMQCRDTVQYCDMMIFARKLQNLLIVTVNLCLLFCLAYNMDCSVMSLHTASLESNSNKSSVTNSLALHVSKTTVVPATET